jgi:8-oxo-dGTP pyrophosphatase MutT (NUDIX family)
LIVDEDDHVLLCRWAFPDVSVWGTPGGGIEPGETPEQALRRELDEEVGLRLSGEPPHVWHQVVVARDHIPGFDGVLNDFFLVRTPRFTPRGSLSDEQLAAENLLDLRWWSLDELEMYTGAERFAPRDMAGLLSSLLRQGLPVEPVAVGL